MHSDSIHRRRQEILQELAGLERVRRGSVTEQFVEGDGRHARRGPYPLYTFKSAGKTVSRRIRGEHAAMYRAQVLAGHRLQELTRELMGLGEALCERDLKADAEKKTPKP
jgi:hypothetical protein